MIPDALRRRLFFRAEDVATAYRINLPSAHVLCSRYAKREKPVAEKAVLNEMLVRIQSLSN